MTLVEKIKEQLEGAAERLHDRGYVSARRRKDVLKSYVKGSATLDQLDEATAQSGFPSLQERTARKLASFMRRLSF